MNCSDVQYLMPLYLSGELDSGSMAQFDRHATSCHACTRQMEEQLNLDKGLRIALISEPVDAGIVRSRVLAEMKRQSRYAATHTARYNHVRVAFAIAAGLLILITLGLIYRDNARYEQASADHVYEVVKGRQTDWRTRDESIGQLVAQGVAMPTSLEQLNIPNYRLRRGKECSIARSRYLHLVYGDGPREISMYVLEDEEHGLLHRIATSLMAPIRSRREAGYNVTEGDADGHSIMLVSTMSQDEEQAMVKDVLQTMS